MKKIYLFCSAGMSTSMLASKMQNVAEKHSFPIEVKAFPDAQIEDIVTEHHPDVILLGPQVKHRLSEISKKYKSQNLPVEVISSEDYGMMNGEKVLKHSIMLIKQSKK